MSSVDPDIKASLAALRRAARAARKLGQQTQTPVYVLQRGEVVNINPAARRHSTSRARRKTG